MSSMMNWALFYRSQGLSIIPVQGKIPLIKWAEFQKRCASEEEIKAWWEKWPEADIGMVTGTLSRRFILDIDGDIGRASLNNFERPNTKEVKTTRGVQFHFSYPEVFEGKTTLAGILPGLDTRGEGGYAKLPPSKYSDGSGRYSWENNGVLSPVPSWLLDLLKEKNRPRQIEKDSNTSWLKGKLDGLKPGNRNDTFTSISGSFRSRGYSSRDIFDILKPHAKEADFSEEELQIICESVGGYTPKSIQVSDAQSISDFLQDEQKVEWLVSGLISKGSIGFVAGLQETGKTWMLIDLAVEMAKGGGQWLGKYETKAAKVLFIDQERHKSETQRRFKAVIGAKNLKAQDMAVNLHIASGTTTRLNLQQSYDAFHKKLNELRPDVVIVDSFATFHTAAENDRTEIQKVLELVKNLRNEFGCTFLFINHEGKSVLHHEPGEHKEPHSADMMGSIAVPAAAELVLTVRRKDNESCMVYMTKNTQGPKIEPFQISIVDAEGGIEVRAN